MVTTVATLAAYDDVDNQHFMVSIPSNMKFIFHGEIPPGKASYSLLGMVVSSAPPHVELVMGDDSKVLYHDVCTWRSIRKVIDVCSGIGALTQGSLSQGFDPVVACDHNSKLLRLHSHCHHVPIVCGDICDLSTVASIWSHAGESSSLSAGVSCQPYSRLGDGKSGSDPRAQSLPGTLNAAFLLRSVVIVLECVDNAQQDAFVKHHVQQFARATGFSCTEQILALQDIWPGRRVRWWCVLTAPSIGPIRIRPFPKQMDVPTIRHLIPQPCRWNDEDEDDLRLDDTERVAFSIGDEMENKYLIDADGKLPCALHAWGNQTRACPCGCRATGLNPERIRQRGLYGALIRTVEVDGSAGSPRHLHACEVAALSGCDPVIDVGQPARLALCGMGQLASPLQSAWVFAHIGQRLVHLRTGTDGIPPETELRALKSWLVMRCQEMWKPNDRNRFPEEMSNDVQMWKQVSAMFMTQLLGVDEFRGFCQDPITIGKVFHVLSIMQPEIVFGPLPDADQDDSGDDQDGGMPNDEAINPGRLGEISLTFGDGNCQISCAIDGQLQPTVGGLMGAEASFQNVSIESICVFDAEGSQYPKERVLCPDMEVRMVIEPNAMPVHHDWPQAARTLENEPLDSLDVAMLQMRCDQEAETPCPRWRNDQVKDSCPLTREDSVQDSFTKVPETPCCSTTKVNEVAVTDRALSPVVRPSADACHDIPCLPMPRVLAKPVEDSMCLAGPPLVDGVVNQNRAPEEIAHECVFPPAAGLCVEAGLNVPEPVLHVANQCKIPPSEVQSGVARGDGLCGTNEVSVPPPFPAFAMPEGCHTISGPSHVDPKDTDVAAGSGLIRDPTEMEAVQQPESSCPCAQTAIDDASASSVPVSTEVKGIKRSLDDGRARIGVVDGQPPSPLVLLQVESLLRMHPPAPDLVSLNCLRKRMMMTKDRLAVLENQGDVWADDEVWFHLQLLCGMVTVEHRNRFSAMEGVPMLKIVPVDPLLINSWLKGKTKSLPDWLDLHFDKGTCVISIAHFDAHWVPVLIWMGRYGLELRFWDATDAHMQQFEDLAMLIVRHVRCGNPSTHRVHRRVSVNAYCGALAVSFLQSHVLQQILPQTDGDVHAVHVELRSRFVAAIQPLPLCVKPWLWGKGMEDIEGKLQVLLQLQGVPSDRSEARAREAIAKIGRTKVEEAIQGRAPWRQLKQLGNNVKFQFLLQSELDEKIQSKAGQDAVGKPKTKRGKKPVTSDEPVQLDPTKMMIAEGIFHHAGKPVPQLQVTQIGPLAEGVILASPMEAEPYLRAGNVVSKSPLALVVLNGDHTVLATSLRSSPVTIPCRCLVNQEPLLVEATVFQIGHGLIERAVATPQVSVMSFDVSTIKFTVYRDEVGDAWETLCQSPIKFLVGAIPLLRLCTAKQCSCPAWRNATQIPATSPILDVWRRQYLRHGFHQEPAKTADMYTACLRVPAELLVPLLSLSGESGIYSEPRSEDAREVDPAFAIIWMQKLPRHELQRLRQINPAVTGLARVGDRFGLRVPIADAANVHKSVKPDAPFLPGGPKQQYLMGPMPFGTDRAGVAKACRDMQWEVRPLQPISSMAGRGSMWVVQSIDTPPTSLVSMTHGEVVITRHKDQVKSTSHSKPQMVGNPDTIALCGTSGDSKKVGGAVGDPWLQNDPWGSWKGVANASAAIDANESLRQLETRIQAKVMASLPQPEPQAMEQDDLPDRMNALEAQVQTLMHKHSSLEFQVQDNAAKHTAQLTQMQNHLFHQVETNQKSVQEMFDAQLCQIRSLLAKRPRDENEWWCGTGGVWSHSLKECWILFWFVAVSCFLSPICCAIQRLACPVSGRKVRSNPKGFRFMVFAVMWMCCVRVGEARHPGPNRPKENEFCLGAFNPSGLTGKIQVINEYLSHGDLWGVTETHLAAPTLTKFRKSLRLTDSQFRYCIGGHPVPHRHGSATAGGWRGVAILSKHPTRPVPTSWPSEVKQSCRVQVAATLLNDLWVTTGVLYGETPGPGHPNCLAHNQVLLKHLVQQVAYHSHGLRVVMGDFNMEYGDVDAFRLLHEAGFRDAQTVWNERYGYPIRPTCKGSTRKDYVFLSPELQGLLTSVELLDDVWSDHSVIQCFFHGGSKSVPRFEWRLPGQLQWPTQFDCPKVEWNGEIDESDAYESLWREVEQAAVRASLDPVPQRVLGRASTRKIQVKYGPSHAPLRAGRIGDVQPNFVGTSHQHAHWFRQLRRMQAYVRYVKVNAPSDDFEHSANVWGAVLRAKGFDTGFTTWWESAQLKTHDAPVQCPQAPPEFPIARAMYDSMLLAVRALEGKLCQQSRTYAKVRRVESPNLIFQDIKQQGPDAVDLLISPLCAHILSVHEADASIVLDKIVPWKDDCPLYCQGIKHAVVISCHDTIWLESVEGLAQGQKVSQTKYTGDVTELCEEFRSVWKARWQRDANVPASRWTTILEFARAKLPTMECPSAPMQVHDLKNVLKTRKSKTARGLDGVSLLDAKALPDPALQAVCDMYGHAQKTGRWADQVVSGRVASLAKTAEPSSAGDYRPITVLGLLYRTWGSFWAKRIIKAMHQILPATLLGSRIGATASQAWFQVLWEIEQAHLSQQDRCGVVADVVKAFNHLPRQVIAESALMIGIPADVVLAWVGAISQMKRFFQVRTSLSKPVTSVTGFPEGDALSCVSMMILDMIFHIWMEVQCPKSIPITYVDDIQVLHSEPHNMHTVMQAMRDFAQHTDLLLDEGKTYTWALSNEGRDQIRQQGFTIRHGGKVLGAHMQFTLRHTNETLTARLKGLKDLFDRLRISPSPYATKVRALRVAAWPKGLHGSCSTMISPEVVHQARSGAMKAINADGSGCNPWLHLGMLESTMTDPGFHLIMDAIRTVRQCSNRDAVCPRLVEMCQDPDARIPTGILTTLLHRLQTLSWQVCPNGMLRDMYGEFCLFSTSYPELVLRAEWAWQNVVAGVVSSRQGMHMFHLVDAHCTRQWLKILPNKEHAAFRKVLNGAIFTNDSGVHWQVEQTSLCPYCQSSDSRFHRFWVCEVFDHCRDKVDPQVRALIPVLPEVLTSFGWSLRPHTWQAWRCMLTAIRPGSLAGPGPTKDWTDVFTDGSCLWSAEPWRIASYAAVRVPSGSFDVSQSEVIVAGHVMGLIQTAYRAELWGVLRALEWALTHQHRIRIWCDCAGVVRGVQNLLAFGYRGRVNGRNSDLWQKISDVIQLLGPLNVRITKVAAHMDDGDAETDFEQWCFLFNGVVDRAAVATNLARDGTFWTLFHKHVNASKAIGQINREVQKCILHISMEVLMKNVQTVDEVEHDQPKDVVKPSPAAEWSPLPTVLEMPPQASFKYGRRLVALFHSWFWQAVSMADSPASWVSYYQLYVDFMLSTGESGPVRFENGWHDPGGSRCVTLLQFNFKRRSAWWAKLAREVVHEVGGTLCTKYTRPESCLLNLHTSCAWVPWSSVRLDRVEHWFLVHHKGTASRNGKSLESLPLAKRDGGFPTQARPQEVDG